MGSALVDRRHDGEEDNAMIAAMPLLLLLPAPAAPAPAPGSACESLARLALPATTIASALSVAAGPMTMPQGPPAQVPALCRVTGQIKPSPDSDVQFEVWMPASGWNGRFEGIGNGGFAGYLDLRALARAAAAGYAAGATDTGHRGTPTDASWALGHPEKVVDFGYRAIHEMTVVGKAIAAAFYARPVQRAYFHGCSNGGRQALMEAQRFPEDYDGIIAGAPANDFTHLLAQAVFNRQATEGDAAAYIPASKIPAIEAATVAQCDAKDGVEDGVVDDPRACVFRAASLLCKGGDSDACLTAPQVGALEKLYAGPHGGVPVHPGLVAGGATGPGSWPLWVTGPEAGKSLIGTFGTQFFRNMVFENPSWDFRTFALDRDTRVVDAKLARTLNSTDPDLSTFRRRGGKLILWHGWSDPAISPLNAIRYYESVQAKMGASQTDAFARLFMLPGVQHCDGGPGPTGFYGAGALKRDAGHDVDLAIERWVEDGVAPAQIVAAKFKTPGEPASGVAATRPLCPYPLVARYKGTGSKDEAGSFSCVGAQTK
jgi:feruloyl esterase